MIALEAKYHFPCLTSFRNRYRAKVRKDNKKSENIEENMKESIAFEELAVILRRVLLLM